MSSLEHNLELLTNELAALVRDRRGAISACTSGDDAFSHRRSEHLAERGDADFGLQGRVVRQRGRICFANHVAAQLFGFADAGELIAAKTDLPVLDEATRLYPERAALCLAEQSVRQGREIGTRADGTFYAYDWIERSTSWEGAPAAERIYLDVRREVAAHQALERALNACEEARRGHEQALSSTSHLLRTPLHAISGYLHALSAETLRPEASAWVDEALANTRELASQIEHLLRSANDRPLRAVPDSVVMPTNAAKSSARPLDVLVVDDNATNRRVASLFLTRLGANVRLADSARAGFAAIEARRPDLVLMDVHMPEQDGLSAIAELRARPRFADLPIYAWTADVREQTQAAARKAGANGLLPKPIAPQQLAGVLARTAADLISPADLSQTG